MIITLFFIFYFLLLLWIVEKEPIVVILYFFLFMNQTTNYISVFYLDHGDVYMRELDKYSTLSYTSSIVFIFNIIAIAILYIGIKKYKPKFIYIIENMKKIRIKNIRYILFFFYIIFFILIFNILISGSPLWVAGINKTTFWSISKLHFLKPISSQISVMVLFSGIFLLYTTFHKKASLLRLSIYGVWIISLIYMILMGHKFGQLLTLTYMFFLPILSYKALTKTLSINKTMFIFFAIIGLFSIVVKAYFVRVYGDYAMDIMEQRIFSMEGQLTYSVIENYFHNQLPNDFNQIIIEIKYILGLTNAPSGMDYLMQKLMPSELLFNYEDEHVKLAQGYIGILLYLYHSIFLSLFIHILFIIIYFFVGIQLLKNIYKYDFILIFIYLKLYFSFATYYAQGYSNAILNIKTLLYIYIYFMVIMSRKMYKKRKVKLENLAYN